MTPKPTPKPMDKDALPACPPGCRSFVDADGTLADDALPEGYSIINVPTGVRLVLRGSMVKSILSDFECATSEALCRAFRKRAGAK